MTATALEAAPTLRPWLALIAGAIVAALLAAAAGGLLAGLVCAFAAASLLAGALRPRLLAPLIAAGCAVLPPYVGWLLPAAGFANLQRGVMYAGAIGLALWTLGERARGRPVAPTEVLDRRPIRLALAVLVASWIAAPLLALTAGPGNAIRALNSSLYQALAFAVGVVFTRDLSGRRLLQLTFALLIVYTIPYWLYELYVGRGAFWWYVPPLPDLLSGRTEMLRAGKVRVAATFGQPLAFSQFLVITVPVVLSLWHARFPRVLTWGIAALGAVALVATRSRSPWVAVIVAVVALVIARRRSIRGALMAGLLVVLAAGIPLVRAVQSHALAREAKALLATKWSKANEAQFSYAGRLFVALGSLRVIRERPLTGYGVNAIATSARLPSVDNYYLAIAVEQGVLVAGLTLLGLLIGWFAMARLHSGAEAFLMTVAAGAYLMEWVFVGLHDTAPLFFLIFGHLFAAAGRGAVGSPLLAAQTTSEPRRGRLNDWT